MGGRSIAIGSTQTVRKSRITPPLMCATRGVAMTEIRPQPSSRANFHTSCACQVVVAAATHTSTKHRAGGMPTYVLRTRGSCHRAQARTSIFALERRVVDEACMFHRSRCAAADSCLVTADRKGLAAYSYHNPWISICGAFGADTGTFARTPGPLDGSLAMITRRT